MKSTVAYDFRTLFEKIPGAYLVLSPDFTIIALSDAYLALTFTERSAILGQNLFKVFPYNHDDINAPEVLNLRASLNYVLEKRRPNELPMEKYKIRRPDGGFEIRYWCLLNTPVFNDHNEVIYIIHKAEDITHGKKVEEQFRSLLEAFPDASIIVNEKGLIEMINHQTEDLFGYSPQEIIGKPVEMLIPEKFNQQQLYERDHFIKSDKARALAIVKEITAIKKDGSIIPVDISLAPIHTDQGLMVTATVRDITQRKEAAEQLELLSRQINESNDAIFIVDGENKIRSWNLGAQKLYGFTKDEAMGKLSDTLLQTGLTAEELVAANKEIDDQDYWCGEITRKTKDGKAIHVHVSNSTIRDSEGTITGYIAVSSDITEQKKLREEVKHLASMVEQSSEAIISIGLNWLIISWNAGAEKLFGYCADEVYGKNASLLGLLRLSSEETAAAIKQVMEAGRWKSELYFYHKDGSSFFGTITANLIKNEKGEQNSIVIVINDISIRKHLEEQLEKSNEELEVKVKSRTEEILTNEKRFRALIENSVEAISLTDEFYNNIYRSPAANKIMGNVSQKNTLDLAHPDDLEAIKHCYIQALSNPGVPVIFQGRFLHEKGHYIWLEGSITNLLNIKAVKAVVSNYRNITKRKEAEEKLIASEKQYRLTLENMLEGVQIIGFDWRYIYVNAAMAKQGKYSKKELLGHTVMEKYPGIEQTAIFKEYQRCFSERVSIQVEYEFIFPDKSKGWFEYSFQPVPEGIFIVSIDITERKKAEQSLVEEKDRFAKIVATVPGLIYSFRLKPDGTLSCPFASNSIKDILGVSHEMVKEDALAVFNGSYQRDRELVLKSITTSAHKMLPWKQEFRYMHPVKGIVWLEANAIPMAEAEGSIIWHGIISDITERKLSQEKIIEQSVRVQTISDNLSGLMIFQLAGESFDKRKFTYLSNGVTKLTGKTPEEVINDPSILYNMILEEDIPKMIAAEKESYRNMSVFNIEIRCRNFKDDIRWLKIISTPRKTNNRQITWDGFQLDITERKKAEEKIRFDMDLLNAVGQSVIATDTRGIIIYWNHAAEKLYGWTEAEATGQNIINITPTQQSKEQSIEIINAIRKGNSWSGEFIVKHKNGTQFPVFVTDTPVYNQEGSIIGIIGVSINISARKKGERRLRLLEMKIANQKVQEQKKMARVIIKTQEEERSHIGKELHDNINQILAGAKIYLGLAGRKNETLQELINYPIELIDRSIEEIRLLSSKLVTPLKNVNLEELIRDLIYKLNQNAITKTDFIYEMADKMVSDDLKLNIYRIIQEQVYNIIKHAEAKNVIISLKAINESINILISDDGKGFNTTSKRKGIGISNIISRVETFNGKIQIKSWPGKGCKISIKIPL